jgi:predicted TIM-barrel fold metal-dependent hydrolase
MDRFDSLVHVTEDGRWLNGRADASFARLTGELDRAGVGRACLVGLAGVVGNGFVLDSARATDGRLVPIAGFDPRQCADASAAGREIAAFADAGFSGIKLHPRLHGFDPLDPRCLAAIAEASGHGLVVFLDTLFRQPTLATTHAADVIDRIAHACAGTRLVLLHGGGPALLEVAEVVRLHPGLVLDLSFTLLKYAGTSLDADLGWVMWNLDERVVIGSDMPEFTPAAAFARAEQLAVGMPAAKWANVAHGNLERLFSGAPAKSAA